VGPRAVFDAVVKRKIPSPHRESNLPQGKNAWHPLDRGLGGLQSRYAHGGDEKNSQSLPGLEPPIMQLVAQRYTTELSSILISTLMLS
jgi:hypothetical protein